MKQLVFKHLTDLKSMVIGMLITTTFGQQPNNLGSIVIAAIVTEPTIIDIPITTIVANIVIKVPAIVVIIIRRVFFCLKSP